MAVIVLYIQREFEESKQRMHQTKDQAKRLLQVAKQKTDTPQNAELSPDLRQVIYCHINYMKNPENVS